MDTLLISLASFIFGVVLCYVIFSCSVQEAIEKKYSGEITQIKYRLWVDAWRYCVFRCLDEWNSDIETYAIRSADATFDEWEKSIRQDSPTTEK